MEGVATVTMPTGTRILFAMAEEENVNPYRCPTLLDGACDAASRAKTWWG